LKVAENFQGALWQSNEGAVNWSVIKHACEKRQSRSGFRLVNPNERRKERNALESVGVGGRII
jgi:hypothetical protein